MTEAAQVCAYCGAQVALGAPRCPECPSTTFTPAPVVVVDSAAADEKLGELAAELGELDAAAPEPQVPDAAPGPAPAAPPRLPPAPQAGDP